jgi:ankyrin repeat protein
MKSLVEAIESHDLDTVQRMLPYIQINEQYDGVTLLIVAVLKNDLPIVKLLLSSGADPMIGNINKCSPLAYAAWLGNIDIAKCLLEKQVNINHQDTNGYTVLHYASLKGHHDLVKMFLEYGADPTIRNKRGYTVKDVVINNKSEYMVLPHSEEKIRALDAVLKLLE